MKLYIPGIPTPKQGMNIRAFYDKKKGKLRGMALPKPETKENCHTMRSLLVQQLPPGFVPFDSRVEINYLFVYPPLKGFKKWQNQLIEDGFILPKESAPDGDNLEKAVNDAMNGIVLADDKLIWKHSAVKGFGKSPGIYMEITLSDSVGILAAEYMLGVEEEVW